MKYGGFKSPKLIELYKFFFNVEFENAHSADADVDACAKCYFKMIAS
jgi:DNA polymerase III epsilon subunit-like protein